MKFLRKSSVLIDCWVDDKEMGRVPLEINLLARLSHPNIVEVRRGGGWGGGGERTGMAIQVFYLIMILFGLNCAEIRVSWHFTTIVFCVAACTLSGFGVVHVASQY